MVLRKLNRAQETSNFFFLLSVKCACSYSSIRVLSEVATPTFNYQS